MVRGSCRSGAQCCGPVRLTGERTPTEGVVRAQVAGLVLPGMRPASDAVPLLLSTGIDLINRGSGVCVSHDAVLMPAMAFLFGAEAAEEWLAPLGGFAVYFREGGPVAVWCGRERPC